jgi:putative nucleotidyltransferase with HDIG domain
MLRTRVRAGATAGLVLSLLFAGVFTAVSLFELYLPALTPGFGQATMITLRVPYGPRIVRGRSQLSYEHARVIVPRGTVLDETNDDHRAAFAYESLRRPPSSARLVAFFVIDFIVCMMLTTYLRQFGQNRVRLLRPQIGLLALAVGSVVIAKGILLFTALPEFWIPMAALPVWVALAFDRRTAFLFELGIAFIASSLLRFDIILLSVLLIRGIAASLFFFKRKHPRQMVVAGTLSGFAGLAAYVCLTIIFQGRFHVVEDLAAGASSNLLACFGGGAAAGLFAMVFREGAERALGHVSRDKLLDLTDLEQPLLRKMAAEAPGSWEHARAMANLAEASSAAIGADALLTRVGAYYHDLGKTVQPKYFVENLAPGERTPHEDLEPEVSADAIMAHVVMGTKILRQGGIPEPVVEFAYTHHGTQTVEYFWHKCKEAGNPKGLTQEHFRYPGMKPQTKETAILMLVDSIEAASRTIFPPEQKKFEEMIQRVIFTKLSGGQLDESGLTLEDLRIITTRMASTLVNMYHGRIKYPWQREADRASPTTPNPALASSSPPPRSPETKAEAKPEPPAAGPPEA